MTRHMEKHPLEEKWAQNDTTRKQAQKPGASYSLWFSCGTPRAEGCSRFKRKVCKFPERPGHQGLLSRHSRWFRKTLSCRSLGDHSRFWRNITTQHALFFLDCCPLLEIDGPLVCLKLAPYGCPHILTGTTVPSFGKFLSSLLIIPLNVKIFSSRDIQLTGSNG